MVDIEKVSDAQKTISGFINRVEHIFNLAFYNYRSRDYRMLCHAWLDNEEGVVNIDYWDGYDGENPPNASDQFPASWLDMTDQELTEAADAFWKQREVEAARKIAAEKEVKMKETRRREALKKTAEYKEYKKLKAKFAGI